jgi:hypothetical protein
MFVNHKEHPQDAFKTRASNACKGTWNWGSCTNFGLKKVFYQRVLYSGSLKKKSMHPLKEVLLIVRDGRFTNNYVPYVVKLLLSEKIYAETHENSNKA